MILYYAMGGGLGHITRSLAILHQAPELQNRVRLMVSSQLAPLALSYAPCPVDIVSGEILSSKRRYFQFLYDYLAQHQVELLVLDTFPFGIVGEWRVVAPSLPRLLIARYLMWGDYLKRVKTSDGPTPCATLILEPLVRNYRRLLSQDSDLTWLKAPILLDEERSSGSEDKAGCLIVHSGNEKERRILKHVAQHEFGQKATITCLFPKQGIYPAERLISRYSRIVSGAGYNMTALASQAPPERKHFLYPFPRRFDNQRLRLKRFKAGLWHSSLSNGAQKAARWLQLQGLNL